MILKISQSLRSFEMTPFLHARIRTRSSSTSYCDTRIIN